MTLAVVGIDPGKTGGVAVLPLQGPPLLVRPLPYAGADDQPQVGALLAMVATLPGPGVEVCGCAVELVNSFGMGRQSAFVFGQGVGALLAAAELARWPLRRVRPQEWQRFIGATKKGGEVDPLGPVSRLFPGVDLLATPRCRKPHMGMVDALGIAEWMRARITGAGSGASPFG